MFSSTVTVALSGAEYPMFNGNTSALFHFLDGTLLFIDTHANNAVCVLQKVVFQHNLSDVYKSFAFKASLGGLKMQDESILLSRIVCGIIAFGKCPLLVCVVSPSSS